MPARIIDGKQIAKHVRADVAARVAALRTRGITARLDAVLADCDPSGASRVYAENQKKMCDRLGIEYHLHTLPKDANYETIAGRVLLLNKDPRVHALMVHLPLPDAIDTYTVQSLIDPDKDVEGVNPANIGNIVYGRSSLAPCTALAVLRMITDTGIDLKGKRALVVGASDHVGKPIAVMLMRPQATVISANKHTENLTDLARSADVLVAAAGVAGLVTKDWIKPGAVVIDVGIHRLEGPDGKPRTVGDVAHNEAQPIAGWLSPVPGGVGPVTVAMLLENVVSAAESAR